MDKSKAFLAVAVVVLLLAVFGWGERHRREAAELRAQLASVEQQISGMVRAEDLESARRGLNELKERVAGLTSELEQVTTPEETAVASTEVAEPANALLDMIASLADQGKENGTEGKSTPPFGKMFGEMFSGEGGKQMAEFSARMAMDMQYGQFFEDLKLPPGIEQEVREIIIADMTEQMTAAFDALGGEDGPFNPERMQEIQNMEQDSTERLRTKLSRVLTPQELAVWEEYEETKEVRVMEQQYGMQLGMFAPGLTPENRDLATQVVVEEMLAVQTEMEQFPSRDAQLESVFDVQLGAYEHARERLAEQLDDDQLAQFDRFVDQQQNMLEMASQMMRGFTGEEEENAEGEETEQ